MELGGSKPRANAAFSQDKKIQSLRDTEEAVPAKIFQPWQGEQFLEEDAVSIIIWSFASLRPPVYCTGPITAAQVPGISKSFHPSPALRWQRTQPIPKIHKLSKCSARQGCTSMSEGWKLFQLHYSAWNPCSSVQRVYLTQRARLSCDCLTSSPTATELHKHEQSLVQ